METPDLVPSQQETRDVRDLAEAGVYLGEREAYEHGLVVLAMGDAYWMDEYGGAYRLCVEPDRLDAVREQLEAYDRESLHWPPPPTRDEPARRSPALFPPLLWVLAVTSIFQLQVEFPGVLERAGGLDARALFAQRELWRPATALFLHADIGHLASNVLAGAFIFSAVLTVFGRVRGALGLALAATLGNVFAAALQYASSVDYRSIGASTSVFAGLGLLTGRATRLVYNAGWRRRWRGLLLPFGAGATLLALYGSGGPDTDVTAHLCGFTVGMVCGAALGDRRSDQIRAGR